jgi:predicted nucleic acid-binding Zn ribbon protein
MTNGNPDAPEEFEKARKRRNAIIAWSLVGFIVLVFLVTIAKMKAGLG